ncbi:hypothetical protein STAFG_1428 [Streptomyces afghaniensis 772]|uniref:Uncharacterized protein n=1 Tax=Streptomyces afghaniensis 772 TaxID=1283301 RepID=S4N2P8_9ACTN|nr:hypothetical protein STAFG_1428 [Streptomyces afghaniensis 772]
MFAPTGVIAAPDKGPCVPVGGLHQFQPGVGQPGRVRACADDTQGPLQGFHGADGALRGPDERGHRQGGGVDRHRQAAGAGQLIDE